MIFRRTPRTTTHWRASSTKSSSKIRARPPAPPTRVSCTWVVFKTRCKSRCEWTRSSNRRSRWWSLTKSSCSWPTWLIWLPRRSLDSQRSGPKRGSKTTWNHMCKCCKIRLMRVWMPTPILSTEWTTTNSPTCQQSLTKPSATWCSNKSKWSK